MKKTRTPFRRNALAIYTVACFAVVMLLPSISTNPKILLIAVVALLGLPLVRGAAARTAPYCWLILAPLVVLCAWIAVQTPVAASDPVFLFGPKEAAGLIATFWMAGVIPGVVSRSEGWWLIRAGVASVTVIIFIGILVSYAVGVGERHQVGPNTFRAYFYFSDAIDVVTAFLILWHAVLRNHVLAIISAAALWMMLGKLALGLLLLNVVVFAVFGRGQLRTGAAWVVAAMAFGLAITAGVAEVRPMIERHPWLTAWSGDSSDNNSLPAVDGNVRACVQRAIDAESFLLRAECAAISAQAYPGSAVVNSGINTLARRTMGVLAAFDIAMERPIFGTGYHQSWRLIERMDSRNPFGLNERFARPELVWYRVGQIRNVWARSLAEFGIPGLILLLAFGVGLVAVAIRVLLIYRAFPDNASVEGTIGAVWVGVFIVAAHTDPWLLPGSVPTAWLGVTVGVMMGGLVDWRSYQDGPRASAEKE